MGWSGGYYPGSVKDYIKNGEVEKLYRYETLAKSVHGNVVYSAIKDDKGQISAVVTLLRKDRDGFLMNKSVPEEWGPCECGCPEKIINMLSSTNNECALAWRERCRNHKNFLKGIKDKRAELDALPVGSKIMCNNEEYQAQENVWWNAKSEGLTVFINTKNWRYGKKNKIAQFGFSLVGKEA
jgi:hypothetical protein